LLNLNFTDVSASIALILSILAILFTYKSVKITKFIETITNQRINWISTLRDDFSKILTLLLQFKRFKKFAKDTEWWLESDAYFEMNPEQIFDLHEEIKEREKQKNIIVLKAKQTETITLIELLILRLNEVDDINLISMLELTKDSFLENDDTDLSEKFIDQMKSEIKQLLKFEWERVKQEVKKGGHVHAKRKNKSDIFWS